MTAATSADTIYNGITVADVAVTNTDNDAAGVTVTSDDRPDDDARRCGTATFTVVLTSAADRGCDHRPDLERHHGGDGPDAAHLHER